MTFINTPGPLLWERCTIRLSYLDRKEIIFRYTTLQIFQRAHCDSDHYLVVAKVREKVAVRK
jgi:hypothetical protein